jgi:HEAT repeat protein
MPRLEKLLDSGDATTRKQALIAIARTGKLGAAAIGKVTTALEDSDPNVRRAACYALASIGEHSNDALTGLKRAQLDKDEEVRAQSVLSLGLLGLKRYDTEAALLKAARRGSVQAAIALKSMHPDLLREFGVDSGEEKKGRS